MLKKIYGFLSPNEIFCLNMVFCLTNLFIKYEEPCNTFFESEVKKYQWDNQEQEQDKNNTETTLKTKKK